jgi:hypothetical protein
MHRLLLAFLFLAGCAAEPLPPETPSPRFTLAVIPDTQNYIDYQHQTAEGFALDAADLFIAQMRDIASRDDIAFVAAVGDVWQHQTLDIDAEHTARGLEFIPNPYFASALAPTPKTAEFELPKAVEGYDILHAAGIPFGVAPGNHDYDAMWSAAGFPPNLQKKPAELTMTPGDLGILHIGGLDNFRSVFGADSKYFRDREWYVASFRGGANAAQTFHAAGYSFLHITLEMAADDDVLRWASGVIEANPGLPTIVTTHDYLNTRGQRAANPLVDLKRIDPDYHNSAEEVWEKLINAYDQIFMVLCGHHHGQGRRVDENRYGHKVYQLLADYQSRGQSALDAGATLDPRRGKPPGVGDGWYRLMHFDMSGDTPTVQVRTWSSHYRNYAGDQAGYADWYRKYEQPQLDEREFLATDEFQLVLEDFRERFGPPPH